MFSDLLSGFGRHDVLVDSNLVHAGFLEINFVDCLLGPAHFLTVLLEVLFQQRVLDYLKRLNSIHLFAIGCRVLLKIAFGAEVIGALGTAPSRHIKPTFGAAVLLS